MQKLSLRRRAAVMAGTAATLIASAIPLTSHAGSAIANLKQGLTNTSSAAGIATSKDLATLVGSFISAALGLLGVILVVLVIYAGFIWMTAQGNEEKIKKAKGMITSAVIGMVIIFAAYAITNFVVSAISSATALQ